MSVIMWKVSIVLAGFSRKHSLKQKLCATSVLGNRISVGGSEGPGQGGSKGGEGTTRREMQYTTLSSCFPVSIAILEHDTRRTICSSLMRLYLLPTWYLCLSWAIYSIRKYCMYVCMYYFSLQ